MKAIWLVGEQSWIQIKKDDLAESSSLIFCQTSGTCETVSSFEFARPRPVLGFIHTASATQEVKVSGTVRSLQIQVQKLYTKFILCIGKFMKMLCQFSMIIIGFQMNCQKVLWFSVYFYINSRKKISTKQKMFLLINFSISVYRL